MDFPLTEKLAYETGIHIGDGNLYSKNRTHKITYSGNLKNEENFYLIKLKPLLEELYGITPKVIRNTSRNAILLVLNSKTVADFKMHTLHLPNGKKTTITIPDLIKQNQTLFKACLKGIADTDFSVSFKKNKRGIYNEPRLELFSRSKLLVEEIHAFLLSLHFTVNVEYTTRRGYIENRLRLFGKTNLEKWIHEIGFLNFNTLLKLRVWKTRGEVPPRLSYRDYQTLLGL
jgi:hypothetical protein